MKTIGFRRAAFAALCLTAPALVAAQSVETQSRTQTQTQTTQPAPAVEVVTPPPAAAPPPAPAYVYPAPAPAPAATTTRTTTVVEEKKSKDDYIGVHPGLEIGGRAMYFKPRGGPDSWSGGAQLRFHVTENWAIEGSADYRRVTIGTPAVGTTPAGSARVDVYPVQASLIGYLFPRSPVTPFVLAGAGWYFTHASTPGGDRTANRFGPHVGAGLQFFMNNHWSVDGSYRYVWIENFRSASTSLPENTYRDSGHMVTAALNYHF